MQRCSASPRYVAAVIRCGSEWKRVSKRQRSSPIISRPPLHNCRTHREVFCTCLFSFCPNRPTKGHLLLSAINAQREFFPFIRNRKLCQVEFTKISVIQGPPCCTLHNYHLCIFAAFPCKANGVALVLSHIGDAQMRDLGNPCACVIEQLKEETIAAASPAGGRGRLQDRLEPRLRKGTQPAALPGAFWRMARTGCN